MATTAPGAPAGNPIASRLEPFVRPATDRDAPALARVHLNTVLVAYAGIFPAEAPAPTSDAVLAEWKEAFADPSFRAFLAEVDGRAVGTVAVRADPEVPDAGQLRRLHVLPELWDRGVGSALYEAGVGGLVADGYREAGLWVLEANGRARSFYERRGWSLVPGRVLEWPGLSTLEVRYRLALAEPAPSGSVR